MSSPSGPTAGESEVPAPGLLILTGASHTGKTSVAETILDKAAPPAAFLSVDNILDSTLRHAAGAVWAEIPLAYELLLPQLETLLDRAWFVIVESTFTYVDPEGDGVFHSETLRRVIATAERRRVPWLLVQLAASPEDALSRADRSGRVSSDIVAHTVELHRTAPLPDASLRLDSGENAADALAFAVLSELRTRFVST